MDFFNIKAKKETKKLFDKVSELYNNQVSIIQELSEELFKIRSETGGTEKFKIECGRKHFNAIGSDISLGVAHNFEKVKDIVLENE
ncbi:hypothetical protein EI427_01185 [Flammeovirga pectinis]|uniref:Uncharacterized protein n=2 Tax=Flammeovirga pectinis TaxID=2494373 RepID=A0A3Q9FLD8_9BACT|nr:hypothetical protein EI427_01185 [Flammeovirga pectinis]